MTIWVAAHGTFDAGAQPRTTVPEGWTLSTYAEDGTVLEKVVGYEVARTGLPPDPGNVYQGPVEIANYQLGALSLVESLDYQTVRAPQVHLFLAGHDFPAPTALCTDTTGGCTEGGHVCTGIFGSGGPLASTGDMDIRLICCFAPVIDGKRPAGPELTVTASLPGESGSQWLDQVTHAQEAWAAAMRQAVQDENARAQVVADFERENEEEKVLLLQNGYIRKFCYGHYGAEIVRDRGAVSFHRWVLSLDESERDLYIASDGPVADGRDAYWGMIGWLAAFESDPQTAWGMLPQTDRQSLLDGDYGLVKDNDARTQLQRVQSQAAALPTVRLAAVTHRPSGGS